MVKEYAGLEKPNDLCPLGEKAYEVIRSFLVEKGLDDCGGCKVFYSPTEWKARGEKYCTGSTLVVVYDGADARRAFNMDYGYETKYKHMNDINERLDAVGVFPEEGTGWYCGIYKK